MKGELGNKIRTFEVIKKSNVWSVDEVICQSNKKVKTSNEALNKFEVIETIFQEQTLEITLATESESKGYFVYEAADLTLSAEKELLIMMWNVNSLNSKLDREHFTQYINSKPFDIICFNETKYSEKKFKQLQIEKHPLWHGKYHQYWHFSTKKLGYAGVCILTRVKPISCKFGFDSAFDCEGRAVTLEFETFYLICVYAPCSGIALERLAYRVENWEEPLRRHVKALKFSKPVMIVGDLNVAHTELDVANVRRAQNFPGFAYEERMSFEILLKSGFKDAYRELNPERIEYSWWDSRFHARAKNDGWRLDYCVISEEAISRIVDVSLRTDVFGSDHCPLEVKFRPHEDFQTKSNESRIKSTEGIEKIVLDD